jgi:hypothetical protein
VTVIIASLLFGVLVFATFIVEGFSSSFKQFSSNTFSDRYLVQTVVGQPGAVNGSHQLSEAIKQRANEIYTQTILDKKAAAKKLGVEYDPAMEQKPYESFGGPEEKFYNMSSPPVARAVNEYNALQPSAASRLDDLIKRFQPQAVYRSTVHSFLQGTAKPLTDGKEDFTKSPDSSSYGNLDLNMGWRYESEAITRPFMLPSSQLEQQDTQALPIIAPIIKVESKLGLKPLTKAATANERLERIRYIRDNAHKAEFTLCYRNSVSQARIDSAIATAKEIEKNKTNKEYQRPSLIYGLPAADSCAEATVLRDVRTKAEKQLAAKQDEFNHQFGTVTEPDQQLMKFRVVGLSPNGSSADSFSGLDSLFTTLAGSTLEGQWVVPRQLFDLQPNKADYERFTAADGSVIRDASWLSDDRAGAILEFATAAEAKSFVDKNACANGYCEDGSIFMYFGSNSVLIDEIKKQITNGLLVAAAVVAGIAAFIMMGMTGRVISDSRRETAVFRAIGARRNDIRAIYIGYTLMLSVIISLMSLLLGLIAAVIFDAKFAPGLTVQGYLTYIFAPDGLTFHLLSPWWSTLGVLVAAVIIAGFAGMLLPLARNLARSPIKDMRDDT